MVDGQPNSVSREALLKGLNPEPAKEFLGLIGPALDQFADQVWCFGIDVTSERRRALGLVAQMAAELILGAEALFASGRIYAGASLVRQLIEVDYLLFLFATDPAEAETWLRSTSDDSKSIFAPAAMRKRSEGRFDVDEYSRHCEMGGHPRPAAKALVDRHHLSTKDVSPILWLDLAEHSVRLWRHYKSAVKECSPTNFYPDRFAPIDDAVKRYLDSSSQVRDLLEIINDA